LNIWIRTSRKRSIRPCDFDIPTNDAPCGLYLEGYACVIAKFDISKRTDNGVIEADKVARVTCQVENLKSTTGKVRITGDIAITD
jgi:hypothetical protein